MSVSLRALLRQKQADGQSALIPFITAGDPDLETTEALLWALAESGADAIELGVPFSDPIADGPVIQRAAERALAQGTHLSAILDLVARVRLQGLLTPLILFSYYNPLYRFGLEPFAQRAKAAGVSAVLVVDLIPEAGTDLLRALEAVQIEFVGLIAPTTDPARLPMIAQAATGCLYYVSRTGVTGAQQELSADLGAELRALARQTEVPIIVGFGISQPEHVQALAGQAAGIVVGSALVDAIAQAEPTEKIKLARERIVALKAPLKEN